MKSIEMGQLYMENLKEVQNLMYIASAKKKYEWVLL